MAKNTQKPTRDNETMREVKRAKAREVGAAEAQSDDKKPMSWKAAAGVGIGSAAVLAALIYANKARNKDS
jgi:hypothetical protein